MITELWPSFLVAGILVLINYFIPSPNGSKTK